MIKFGTLTVYADSDDMHANAFVAHSIPAAKEIARSTWVNEARLHTPRVTVLKLYRVPMIGPDTLVATLTGAHGDKPKWRNGEQSVRPQERISNSTLT